MKNVFHNCISKKKWIIAFKNLLIMIDGLTISTVFSVTIREREKNVQGIFLHFGDYKNAKSSHLTITIHNNCLTEPIYNVLHYSLFL